MPSQKLCLAFDLGGTKLEVGLVSDRGHILETFREKLVLEHGKEGLFSLMTRVGQTLLEKYPEIEAVGISSCGPLDVRRGLLLDPTNLMSDGKGWGTIEIVKILSQSLQRTVYLQNDAACSALAERWLGLGKENDADNLVVLTLGTGLGVGVIVNKQLFCGGRFLHPEAGHIIISHRDKERACACGVSGDAEAYLSGKHFEDHFNALHKRNEMPISAGAITELARKGDPAAKKAFAEYAEVMASAIHNYCVIFYPELIVFGGSFAESFDQFSEQTMTHLKSLLKRRPEIVPQLKASTLQNHSSLLGAASLCF
ncbi:MAG: ROK family protein [Oligoflexales bacterium]|nr:ROK family protein [Oligoflexales bacterium]